jgi:hypothetical protein
MALNQLNEKLSESVREKENQIKEIHRQVMVEKEASKRAEREAQKKQMGNIVE